MIQDVNVVVMDFKTSKANEMVSINEDGSYTILINARLSYDGQIKAYEHAMKHIHENDFEKDNVQAIEYNAHNINVISEPAKTYLERLQRLREEHNRLKRQIQRDEKRVQFLIEHCDMFKRAEHHYLYGNDL